MFANLTSEQVFTYLKLLGIAFLIFLLFFLLRKILANKIINFLLKLTKKTKTRFDDYLIKAFEVPLQLFFTFLGLYLAFIYLPLKDLQLQVVHKLFRSAIIVLITMGFYKLFGDDLFRQEMEGKINVHLDKTLIPFIANACRIIIVLLGVGVLASEWNYDINGLIAGLGIGGLAVALAAQSTLSNLFGGLAIITDKPFSIGDWIQTPNLEGVVEDINFRSTRVRTFNDAVVIIPNSTLANESITNWSRMGKRRAKFNLVITYSTSKSSLQQCLEKIRALLLNHPGVAPETVFVNLESFVENGYSLYISYFTRTTDWREYLKIKEDINFKIIDILKETGVELAFPSRTLYFDPQLESLTITNLRGEEN